MGKAPLGVGVLPDRGRGIQVYKDKIKEADIQELTSLSSDMYGCRIRNGGGWVTQAS